MEQPTLTELQELLESLTQQETKRQAVTKL